MMKNRYVDFISDEHLISCIGNLHQAYLRAKNNITKQNFYSNKVDTIKLTFDSNFNDIDEESLIQSEILRQIDKSINNSIGTFHEQVLGGIKGFEVGNSLDYDIKAKDNTLFADIHNNIIKNSLEESLFKKIAHLADTNKKAKCYWVQLWAEGTFIENWAGEINDKEYSHSRVYKISGDQFYALLSGQDDALLQLYKAIPKAIQDYLDSIEQDISNIESSIVKEIKSEIEVSKRTVLDQISFENYGSYLCFERL